MDPKSIANLDPKLRETYERVMGNSSAAPMGSPTVSSSTPDANTNTSIPSPTLSSDLSSPVLPDQQLSSTLTDSPLTPPLSTPETTPSPADPLNMPAQAAPAAAPMQPLASPASVAQGTQNAGSLIRVLYIFGGIIFFMVYIFFWVRIFNYQLPF